MIIESSSQPLLKGGAEDVLFDTVVAGHYARCAKRRNGPKPSDETMSIPSRFDHAIHMC